MTVKATLDTLVYSNFSMDDLCFYGPFSSSVVILFEWKNENERLCAVEHCLWLQRVPSLAGFKLEPLAWQSSS